MHFSVHAVQFSLETNLDQSSLHWQGNLITPICSKGDLVAQTHCYPGPILQDVGGYGFKGVFVLYFPCHTDYLFLLCDPECSHPC